MVRIFFCFFQPSGLDLVNDLFFLGTSKEAYFILILCCPGMTSVIDRE